jgi:hypothetical protein
VITKEAGKGGWKWFSLRYVNDTEENEGFQKL